MGAGDVDDFGVGLGGGAAVSGGGDYLSNEGGLREGDAEGVFCGWGRRAVLESLCRVSTVATSSILSSSQLPHLVLLRQR